MATKKAPAPILDCRGNPRVQTTDFGDSLTVKSDAHLADIRQILKKYEGTGIVDHLDHVDSVFMDVSEFTDYQDMLQQLDVAEAEFMKLPPQIRSLFDNQVGVWLDAAQDTDKRDAFLQELQDELDARETISAQSKPGVDQSQVSDDTTPSP